MYFIVRHKLLTIELKFKNNRYAFLIYLEEDIFDGFNYKIYSPTLNSMAIADKTIKYGMLVTY